MDKIREWKKEITKLNEQHTRDLQVQVIQQEEIKKLRCDRTELIANIRYFVNRVEVGIIISKNTYAIYKNLLGVMDKESVL